MSAHSQQRARHYSGDTKPEPVISELLSSMHHFYRPASLTVRGWKGEADSARGLECGVVMNDLKHRPFILWCWALVSSSLDDQAEEQN